MCGTSIIDCIFFPGLFVCIMVAFMDPKLVIIEGDVDGWSSIDHSVYWICFFIFFFFFFWGIQIFQKMTDSSYFRSNSSASPVWRTDINCNKLLLSSFSGKPLFAQSLQLIPCKWVKWLTSISISLHVEGKGLWVCMRMTI